MQVEKSDIFKVGRDTRRNTTQTQSTKIRTGVKECEEGSESGGYA